MSLAIAKLTFSNSGASPGIARNKVNRTDSALPNIVISSLDLNSSHVCRALGHAANRNAESEVDSNNKVDIVRKME
jgi:hypothetical protein